MPLAFAKPVGVNWSRDLLIFLSYREASSFLQDTEQPGLELYRFSNIEFAESG